MKTLLLAGAAALLVATGASAQIQSPAQPGMAPATGMSAQGGASGNMAGESRNTRSMTATTGTTRRVSERRTTNRRAVRPEDQAYMGGGMILENGRPVDMGGTSMGGASMGGSGGMMTDRGVGTARGRIQDPTGMGMAVMPGGTGTGRGAGATGSGGN